MRRLLLAVCRDERGLTLVELVLVMAIMGVVFGSVSLLLVRGTTVQSNLNARFQNQTNARVALDRLRADVRCAQSVSGGATSVALTLPAGCGGGAVTWCTTASGSSYELHRVVGAGGCATGVRWASSLASGSVFTITPQSSATLAEVTVRLQAAVPAPSSRDAYTLQDTLVLRNSSRQ